jgi:eukaryotic-like serine/threonine-protein kinase
VSQRSAILHLKPGMVLDDHYRLIRMIGRGSMAEVWEALDEARAEPVPVAVKVVAEILAPSEQARLRFAREVRAIGSIHHPNVVALLDHGSVRDGRPYLVMELVLGETLSSHLKRGGPFDLPTAVHLGREILSGLEAAHALGIIHRDLKPANLLLAGSPSSSVPVKILDFGVARILDLASEEGSLQLTRTGTVLGSPCYMAAEVARGARGVDERSDLFSVGAILYHALAGRPPFGGKALGEILGKILRHEIEPLEALRPDTPPSLRACIARALGKTPGERWASAAEMRAALEEVDS